MGSAFAFHFTAFGAILFGFCAAAHFTAFVIGCGGGTSAVIGGIIVGAFVIGCGGGTSAGVVISPFVIGSNGASASVLGIVVIVGLCGAIAAACITAACTACATCVVVEGSRHGGSAALVGNGDGIGVGAVLYGDVIGAEGATAEGEVGDALSVGGEDDLAGAGGVLYIGDDVCIDSAAHLLLERVHIGDDGARCSGHGCGGGVSDGAVVAGRALWGSGADIDAIAAFVELYVGSGEVGTAQAEVADALTVDREGYLVGAAHVLDSSVDGRGLAVAGVGVGGGVGDLYCGGWQSGFIDDYGVIAGGACCVAAYDFDGIATFFEADVCGAEARAVEGEIAVGASIYAEGNAAGIAYIEDGGVDIRRLAAAGIGRGCWRSDIHLRRCYCSALAKRYFLLVGSGAVVVRYRDNDGAIALLNFQPCGGDGIVAEREVGYCGAVEREADLVGGSNVGSRGCNVDAVGAGVVWVAAGCGDAHGWRVAHDGGSVDERGVIACGAVVVRYGDNEAVVACLQVQTTERNCVVTEAEAGDRLTVEGNANLVGCADVGRGSSNVDGLRAAGIRRIAWVGNLHSRRIANYYGCCVDDSRVIARCAVVVRYSDADVVVACLQSDIAQRNGIAAETESIYHLSIYRYADLVDVGDVRRSGYYCSAGSIRVEGVASRRSNLHGRRIANYYGCCVDDSRVIARCAVVVRYGDVHRIVALLERYRSRSDGIIAQSEIGNTLTIDCKYHLVYAGDIGSAGVDGYSAGGGVEGVASRRGNLHSRRIANHYGRAINDSRVIARCAVVVRYNDIYAVVALL